MAVKVCRMAPRGRPRSIPEGYFVRVFRWKLAGDGYQTIATRLNALGVATTRGSVERLVKGRGCYAEGEDDGKSAARVQSKRSEQRLMPEPSRQLQRPVSFMHDGSEQEQTVQGGPPM